MDKIKAIAKKYKDETAAFLMGEELSPPLYEELFEHYLSSGELPTDLAKCRTGDPEKWIAEKYENDVVNIVWDKVQSKKVKP